MLPLLGLGGFLLAMGASLGTTLLVCWTIYEVFGFIQALWELAFLLTATGTFFFYRLFNYPTYARNRAMAAKELEKADRESKHIHLVARKMKEYKEQYGRDWQQHFNTWLLTVPDMDETPEERHAREAQEIFDEDGIPYL